MMPGGFGVRNETARMLGKDSRLWFARRQKGLNRAAKRTPQRLPKDAALKRSAGGALSSAAEKNPMKSLKKMKRSTRPYLTVYNPDNLPYEKQHLCVYLRELEETEEAEEADVDGGRPFDRESP